MRKKTLTLRKARTFVKSLLPTAAARKRSKSLGIWDIFANNKTFVAVEYGFTLEEAWVDTAIRLGYTYA